MFTNFYLITIFYNVDKFADLPLSSNIDIS